MIRRWKRSLEKALIDSVETVEPGQRGEDISKGCSPGVLAFSLISIQDPIPKL